MTRTQEAIRHFVMSAIQQRLDKNIPPCPETVEELSSKIAEGLIYISFLPHVLTANLQTQQPNGEMISYPEVVKSVADEVHVAISEYLNGGDKLDPRFPVHASSHLIWN